MKRRGGLVGVVTCGVIACGGHPTPPPAPAPAAQLTCEQVAPSVDVLVRQRAGGGAAQRTRIAPFVKAMKAQVVQSCVADGWSMALRACLVGAHGHADFEGCERLFTPAQQRRFEVATEQVIAATLPELPAAPVGAAADGSTGIGACDVYLQVLDRYAACDKVPEQARRSLREMTDRQREAWKSISDPAMPAPARDAAVAGCKQATDAVAQSASALGCAI